MSQRETWPGEGLPVPAEAELDEVEELDRDEVEEDATTSTSPTSRTTTSPKRPRRSGTTTRTPATSRRSGSPASTPRASSTFPTTSTCSRARRGTRVAASASSSRGSTARSSNQLLASALAELERVGVPKETITVMAVPGAFELPLGAMALAKTRRYSCIVALGCVIRGETAHFDYISGEAASGLQLAALETGVPVAFGVLTVDTLAQAEARVDKGADAVRTALEMADLFSQLRATAQSK